MPTAIIDGDVLAFLAAGATEERHIVAFDKDDKKHIFSTRTELKDYCQIHNLQYQDFTVEDVQTTEPISHACHIAKQIVKKWTKDALCDKYKVYCGYGETFRHELPLPEKYKSNREHQLRPVHTQDVKQYLVDKCNGQWVTGLEADDYLSIESFQGYKQYKKTGKDSFLAVAVTTDKDAMGTPGFVYNPDKHEKPFLVEGLGELWDDGKDVRGYGRKWKYYQLLYGDPGDFYKPTKHIKQQCGRKKALNLLQPLATDEECMLAVANEYYRWFGTSHTYKAWDGEEVDTDWKGMLDMYFKLVHMRRWKKDQPSFVEGLRKKGLIEEVEGDGDE